MSTPELATLGPCSLWVSAEDVADVCDAIEHSGDPSVYDDFAQKASDALYILSARQFAGECGPIVVRPCDRTCECVHPGRYFGWYATGQCGCLSRVKLSGYPVREIVEVLIDGVAIDASEYRLDGHRWLTRLADADGNAQRWPHGQRLDLATTEEDTWSVEYTYGMDPPALGSQRGARACLPARPRLPRCRRRVLAPGRGNVGDPAGDHVRDGNRCLGGADEPADGRAVPAGVQPERSPRSRSTVWSPDIQPYAKKYG